MIKNFVEDITDILWDLDKFLLVYADQKVFIQGSKSIKQVKKKIETAFC